MSKLEKQKKIITSVKIPEIMYEDFKVLGIRTRMNLQDIVERSIYLYVTNTTYRAKMHELYDLHYTGSTTIK